MLRNNFKRNCSVYDSLVRIRTEGKTKVANEDWRFNPDKGKMKKTNPNKTENFPYNMIEHWGVASKRHPVTDVEFADGKVEKNFARSD